VDEASWVPLTDMPTVLTHLNERRLVDIARRIVDERTPLDLGFRS
jgi:microsomal dipeptidase-like Zn-dependent dipeptidase